MDKEELLKKLRQIEQQASAVIAEFPTLTRERARMIMALARCIRTAVEETAGAAICDDENMPVVDRGNVVTRTG
jgi:hypothetical protein